MNGLKRVDSTRSHRVEGLRRSIDLNLSTRPHAECVPTCRAVALVPDSTPGGMVNLHSLEPDDRRPSFEVLNRDFFDVSRDFSGAPVAIFTTLRFDDRRYPFARA